jgi:hypothetical protein
MSLQVRRGSSAAKGNESMRSGEKTRGIQRSASAVLWVVGVLLLLPELALAASIPRAGAGLTLAYIDPGTGSFLVQALVAAVAGIAVTLRMYWSKIRSIFGGTTVAAEGEDAADASRDDD